jgi:hypothetical protein
MKPAVIFFIYCVFSITICHACDCDNIISLNTAKSVFIGKVNSIEYIDSSGVRYKVAFDVLKSFKGDATQSKAIVHVMCLSAACCGFPFDVNGFYFIYTAEENNRLYTSDCTQNAILKNTSYLLR